MQAVNIHALQPSVSVTNEIATVVAITEQSIVIGSQSGPISAKLSSSCFLQPQQGDVVQVVQSSTGAYVVAVLEQSAGEINEVRLPKDATITAEDGQLTIQSSLFNLHSTKVEVLSNTTGVHAHRLNVKATDARATFGDCTTTMKRFTQHAKNVVRFVEGVETLSIGNLVRTVRENLISRSKQSVITSEEDMKIDAKRIHMG